MNDRTGKELDESTLLSADRTNNSEFFIDDYSHLRLSYYQYRNDISLDVSNISYQDSAYSTNASTNESCHDNSAHASTDENCHENEVLSTESTNSKSAATNSKVFNEEERRKLREFYVSQIPDLPHPSYTVASIIASASHRMNPSNRFVYNNRIEQGNARDENFEMETFQPQRRSTLKPEKSKELNNN